MCEESNCIKCDCEISYEGERPVCDKCSIVMFRGIMEKEEIIKEISDYLNDIQSRIDVRYEELSTIERKEYSELNSEEKKKIDFCRKFQIIKSDMKEIWFKIGNMNDIGFRKDLYQLLQLSKEDTWLRRKSSLCNVDKFEISKKN